MNNKSAPHIIALMGVVVGVLGTLAISAVLNGSRKRPASADWTKLNLVLEQVKANYVDEVDVNGITEAAIVAALKKLDPHTVYLPPVEQQEASEDLAGNFDGIGIQFNVPNDTAIVLEVISGGPSESVGLMPGDRLLEVDGKVIAGVKYPQDSIVKRIKGPAGTKVNLKVGREKETIDFEITRGKIPLHSVDAAFMLSDTVGYIRLTKFSATTFQEVSASAADLLAQGMKKVVLDLRDNTGGYFNQAILLANMFLDKGQTIVYLEGLHRSREIYNSNGMGLLRGIEPVLLLNENSASSTEIFAGAIQDNKKGVIVGRRSFGKGLVQEPLFFSDGSAVRISVARYYTPSGRCIQRSYDDGEEAYSSDIYRRYADGELFSRDSVHADEGGIVPDIYVPMDTTKASDFYIKCSRKAVQMRFASYMFDNFKARLSVIDNFAELESYLERINVEGRFLKYAASQGFRISTGEWADTRRYMMPQVKALVGRYSKLGQIAYYKFYLPIDETLEIAKSASLKDITEQ